MKKIIVTLFIILGLSAMFLSQSCHTSQRGIVPCPSYGKLNQTKSAVYIANISDIQVAGN